MQHIEIAHPSIGQIRKMRKGMGIRVKKGTGFNLIVHPSRYNAMAHTFSRDKGIEIALSPEELQANANKEAFSHLPMSGGSIFGAKFDREHPKLMSVLHPIGEHLKPLAKEGLRAATAAGATALTSVAPEFAPWIAMGAAGANKLGDSYLDNPDKYYAGARDIHGMFNGHQSNAGGPKSNPMYSMASQKAKAKGNELLNQHLGTNYDYMSRAGLENAGAHALNSRLANRAIIQKYSSPPMNMPEEEIYGAGFHHRHHGRGFGLGGSIGRFERSSIGTGAGFIGHGAYTPPALISQPSGANFQMQYFLPPQYQQYWNPHHDYNGSGLYA